MYFRHLQNLSIITLWFHFSPSTYPSSPTHLWPFSKSKFNLKSDRVNLVAPASPNECLLYLPNVRVMQYKLGLERLTRLGNSNALRLPVLLSHFFLPLLRLSLFNPFPILTCFLLTLFPFFPMSFSFSFLLFPYFSFPSTPSSLFLSLNSPISTNISLHLSVPFFPLYNPSFLFTFSFSSFSFLFFYPN